MAILGGNTSMITKTLREDLQYTFDKLSNEEKEKLKGCSVLITGCAGFWDFILCIFSMSTEILCK